jgi:hypothetical protein
MKKQTGKMLIQDMGLKDGERFKVGRYTMVYTAYDGGKFDTILPLKIWKQRQRKLSNSHN